MSKKAVGKSHSEAGFSENSCRLSGRPRWKDVK